MLSEGSNLAMKFTIDVVVREMPSTEGIFEAQAVISEGFSEKPIFTTALCPSRSQKRAVSFALVEAARWLETQK